LLQELAPPFDFSAASSVLLLLFSAASFLFDWSAPEMPSAGLRGGLSDSTAAVQDSGFILQQFFDCVRILAGENRY
jgi:hypothetical protein